MIQRHGWNLLFHDGLIEQLQKLHAAAAERARAHDPVGCASNANVKLFHALTELIFDVVPGDPGQDEYRQGNTMGPAFRHWRRAKIGRRFRLFFRYDAKTRIIIFAWVNDEHTLRSSGSKVRGPCAQTDFELWPELRRACAGVHCPSGTIAASGVAMKMPMFQTAKSDSVAKERSRKMT